MKYENVKVGVTILITWQKQLLLAQRKGSHGDGTWDTPGGHLDAGETILDCGIREAFEETGLVLNKNKFFELGFTEDFFVTEQKHYLSCVLWYNYDTETPAPQQKEPDKFYTEWLWYDYTSLPKPLFIPIQNALYKWPRIF